MSTGYLVGGFCYPNTADALQAFAAKFPSVSNGIVYNLDGGMAAANNTYELYVSHYDIPTQSTLHETLNGSWNLCQLPADFVYMGFRDPSLTYILFVLIFIVGMMGFRAGFRP